MGHLDLLESVFALLIIALVCIGIAAIYWAHYAHLLEKDIEDLIEANTKHNTSLLTAAGLLARNNGTFCAWQSGMGGLDCDYARLRTRELPSNDTCAECWHQALSADH